LLACFPEKIFFFSEGFFSPVGSLSFFPPCFSRVLSSAYILDPQIPFFPFFPSFFLPSPTFVNTLLSLLVEIAFFFFDFGRTIKSLFLVP